MCTISYLFFLSALFPRYESQKFPYDCTVLHDSLHVDCLTISKHLVAQSIDWSIPEKEREEEITLISQPYLNFLYGLI